MINQYIGSITGNNFHASLLRTEKAEDETCFEGKECLVKQHLKSDDIGWLSHKICLFLRKSSMWVPPVLKSAYNKGSEMKCVFVVFTLSAAVSYQKEFLLCWCSGGAQGQAETQSSLIQYQHVRWTPYVYNFEISFYSALNQNLAHFYLIRLLNIVLGSIYDNAFLGFQTHYHYHSRNIINICVKDNNLFSAPSCRKVVNSKLIRQLHRHLTFSKCFSVLTHSGSLFTMCLFCQLLFRL